MGHANFLPCCVSPEISHFEKLGALSVSLNRPEVTETLREKTAVSAKKQIKEGRSIRRNTVNTHRLQRKGQRHPA